MALQRRPATPTDVDLEETAELPVLDLAAAAEHAAQQVDDALARTDTLHGPGVSGAIELADNLRDVEERLQRKAERLATLERDLEAARLAERLTRETVETQARQLEQLGINTALQQQTMEKLQASLAEVESTLAQRESSLAQRERTIAEMQEAAQKITVRMHDTEAERAKLAQRATYLDEKLTTRNSEHENLQGEQRATLARLAARDTSYARLQLDYTDSMSRNEAHLEALRSVEGYRQINDGLVGERDAEIQEQQAQIAQLQADLAQLAERDERIGVLQQDTARAAATLAAQERQIQELTTAGAASALRVTELTEALQSSDRTAQAQSESLRVALAHSAELESQLAAERDRHAELVLQISAVRTQLADHVAAADKARTAYEARIAGFADAEKLQRETATQFADLQETIGSLQGELTSASERMGRFEEDLHAAEDQINRLETEQRQKDVRTEELVRSADSLQSRLGEALRSLGEREELVRRLEAEAHASAAVLGNLQQSIKRLGSDENSVGGQVLAEQPAENLARLLVRLDGDSEVVHVLGRKTTVGRTPDNDIQIETSFISRHHAVLLTSARQSIIEDLNSTNGVYVNGRRITRQILQDGDAVTVGKTEFRFSIKPTAHGSTHGEGARSQS